MSEYILGQGSLGLLVFTLLLAGLGLPLPEDPILLAAGALAYRSETVSPWFALPAVYSAAIAADCSLFFFAWHFGEALLGKRPFRWLATTRRRERARELLARYGGRSVFFGRHIAGVRVVLILVAGAEHMRFRSFLLFDALAGLVTIPAIFGLGYLFSNHLDKVHAGIAKSEHWVMAGAGLVLLIFIVFKSLARAKRSS